VTTALIVLPLAARSSSGCCRCRPRGRALALLVALAEVGSGSIALGSSTSTRGSSSRPAQLVQRPRRLYHVGLYGFSLFLVGLSVVVMAAAIGYGYWVGRDNARAYHGSMLFLTGAIVGFFTAQDLLVFYAFFDAMLIPLYVLVGVWGGPNRSAATLKLVIYTLAGSLLMLAAVVAFGLSQGTFDLIESGTSSSTWIFLGFMAAFAVKSPFFPFHGWLPDAYREAPPEVSAVLSGVVSKAARVRAAADRDREVPGAVDDLQRSSWRSPRPGLIYGSLLAFRAPGHPRRDRVLVDGADGP
jgi:NADH-quinone oxidoreductase subunit M